MAWISFYIVGQGGLNETQQRNNGNMFWSVMRSRGFTACAAAAIWSNILCESGGNPRAWETGNVENGFGLTQWTPSYKFTDWARNSGYDPNSGDVQCLRIALEFLYPGHGSTYEQYYSTGSFPVSASEFRSSVIGSGRGIEWWSEAFTRNYERCDEAAFQARKETQFGYARTYYQIFSGSTPDPPTPPPTPGKYSISCQQSGSGAVDVTPWKPSGYNAGESVTVLVQPSSGWRLKQINTDPELYLTESGQTFIMPAANLVIFAVFEEAPEPEKEVVIALRLAENRSLELRIDGTFVTTLPNDFDTFKFKMKGGKLI